MFATFRPPGDRNGPAEIPSPIMGIAQHGTADVSTRLRLFMGLCPGHPYPTRAGFTPVAS